MARKNISSVRPSKTLSQGEKYSEGKSYDTNRQTDQQRGLLLK